MSSRHPALQWLHPDEVLLPEELERRGELEALFLDCVAKCSRNPSNPSAIECITANTMAADLWMLVRETSTTSQELAVALATPSASEQRRNVFRLADDRFRLRAQVLASIRQTMEFLHALREDGAAETPKLKALRGGRS